MSDPSDNPLKRIIGDIYRRSLWQVLGIYMLGSWFVYEVVQSPTEGLGLPEWFPALAIVLLLIALPKMYPHGIVRLESALTLIVGDPSIVAGNDTLSTAGTRAWAYHWAVWTTPTEFFRQGLFRTEDAPTVERYLEQRARSFPSSRPHDFVVQGRACSPTTSETRSASEAT